MRLTLHRPSSAAAHAPASKKTGVKFQSCGLFPRKPFASGDSDRQIEGAAIACSGGLRFSWDTFDCAMVAFLGSAQWVEEAER